MDVKTKRMTVFSKAVRAAFKRSSTDRYSTLAKLLLFDDKKNDMKNQWDELRKPENKPKHESNSCGKQAGEYKLSA